MTFALTPKTAFPRPQSDGFPQGIQWQADGTPLGDRHVQTVDLVGFGSGGVTRDADTLTVVAPSAAPAGGGYTTSREQSINLTASLTYNLNSQFQSIDGADYQVMMTSQVDTNYWVPVIRAGQPNNAVPGLITFTIGGTPGAVTITFSDVSESGDAFIRELA